MGNNFTTRFQARFAIVFVLCALVVLTFPLVTFGQSANAIEQAIAHLEANEPEQARTILKAEVAVAPSAIAYANLATAELALRNLGEAAYAFEMSRALGGFSEAEAFRQNLQQGLPAELRSLGDGPLRKVFQPILRVVPENAFGGIALFTGLLACLLVLAMLFKAGFSGFTWAKLVLLSLVGVCAVSLVLAKARSNYRISSSGVVLQSTQLYKAPSEQSERIRNLPEGAVLIVGELLNSTYRVKLPTGVEGWVPETDIRMVEVGNL